MEFAIVMVIILLVFSGLLIVLYRQYPLHLIFKSKSEVQEMLDGVTDPLVEISKNFVVKRANKAYTQFLNSSFEEIIGQKCYHLLRGRKSPCTDCTLQETLLRQTDTSIERSEHPSGKGALSLHLTPCTTTDENNESFIIEHIRDISVLESLKIDLEEKNQSLANTMKHLKAAQQNIKDELRLARIIQQGILPKSAPSFEGTKINLLYHPITDVGGDVYDFIRFSPTRLGIFIGDASGHGLAAAFVGTISKMSLYHNSKEEFPVNELLSNINKDLLANIHTSHYLTCFWGIIDTSTNILTYSRAGHPFPVVLKRDGSIQQLNSAGTFIGILENAVYDVNSVQLEKNDRIFLFTDGIYDVLDRNENSKETLGYDRFVQMLSTCNCLPFNKILSTVQQNLSDYSYHDDYTLITIEITNAAQSLSGNS